MKKFFRCFIILLLLNNSAQKEYHLVTSNGHPSETPYFTFSSKFKEQCISICGTTRKCYSYTIKEITDTDQYECQFYDIQTWQSLDASTGVKYYFINAKDCKDWYTLGARGSGVYKINWRGYFKDVRCNMEIEGGGWIVFQRRFKPLALNFQRNWESYKSGFGDLHQEFWLGNEFVHEMTSSGNHYILVYGKKDNGETEISKYGSFYIENESGNYAIHFNTNLLAGVHSFYTSTGYANTVGQPFLTMESGSVCVNDHGPSWFKACAFICPNKSQWIRWSQFSNAGLQEIQMMFKAK